jgi:hypothetical protein
MNAAVAYARSRKLPRAALVSLAIAFAATLYAGRQVQIPQLRYLSDFSVPLAATVPVAHAVVLATTLFSPMADLEHTAAQPMRRYRATHTAVLLALGAVLAALPLAGGLAPDVCTAAVRNVTGYLGLAMIGARVFGSGLAWLLPLAMFAPTLLLGVGADNTPETWAWSIHSASSASAAVIAAALWFVGLVAAATGGPRRNERAERQ